MIAHWLVAISDCFISILSVCSSFIFGLIASCIPGLGSNHPLALVIYLYFFARFRRVFNGGDYNPLLVLCNAIAGDFIGFLFTVFVRIPSQVIGSIIGVKLINSTFSGAAHGPRLNVDINQGALTEGALTLTIVIILLGLKKSHLNFTTNTWISSICRVILHTLGSDITGGIMNPASAFGWAYAKGEHMKKEHLCVYWLAPLEAALLGVWICSLFSKPPEKHKGGRQCKEDGDESF